MSILKKALILTGLVAAIPLGGYAWAVWTDNPSPMAVYLGSNGFVENVPASTLVNLGSLYYVDWNSKVVERVCKADDDDVIPLIQHSHGVDGTGHYWSIGNFLLKLVYRPRVARLARKS